MALNGLINLLETWKPYATLRDALASGRALPWVLGPAGAQKAFVLAPLLLHEVASAGRPVLISTAGREAAERLHDDLSTFAPFLRGCVRYFPSAEVLPYDDFPASPEANAERLVALRALADAEPVVILAPVAALQRGVTHPSAVRGVEVTLSAGELTRPEEIAAKLASAGFDRVPLVQVRGTFAVRGGIIDVFSPSDEHPVRIEWFGDVVESIRRFDPETQRSEDDFPAIEIVPVAEPAGDHCLIDVLPPGTLVVLDEPPEMAHQARAFTTAAEHTEALMEEDRRGARTYFAWEGLRDRLSRHRVLPMATIQGPADEQPIIEMPLRAVEPFAGRMQALAQEAQRWVAASCRVVVASAQAHRVAEMLQDGGLAVDNVATLDDVPPPGGIVAVPAALSNGFHLEEAGLVVVSDAEVLGWRRRRRKFRVAKEGAILRSWTDLSPQDLVVHIHHGIGRFIGMVRKTVNGAARDYLYLSYAQGDAVFVPTDQINLAQRYIGVDGQAPKIHRLGTAEWEREKRKVKEATQEIARELLDLNARRETARGHAFSSDSPWQAEMEASFQFEETPDQWKAIEDVKRDMESERPMDRLIAGDVGYGKTEIAVRAAFKAVMDGRQVAVVVPTTLLAQQHYDVFRARFAAFPVRVEMVSRFRTTKEIKTMLAAVAAGEVDVVIGTHRLLQKDVRFHELGLVIIDEEQRFGVTHKERLKKLRAAVDVLTLTATPIPRTLHMSLVGLRDMSVMETPPYARQPVRTIVGEETDALLTEAIRRELARAGQIYVVYNRVERIDRTARRIAALVPEARVAIAHGQMPETQLEDVMLDFVGGRTTVLVCTTIVEIGLDIPRVNTILVLNAHAMGLSQLYQLRGRVGRSDRQAYAYLLYPAGARLTPEAEQRLHAMREFVELGSGLQLAMRDLEIRGAGNLLGAEQHGHLAAVGFDLYTRLLEEAIRRLRGEFVEEAPDPVIELPVPAFLPEAYVPDERQRLAAYRRLASVRSETEVAELRAEMRDRYGDPPAPASMLVDIVALRERARAVGVASIGCDRRGVLIRLRRPLASHEAAGIRLEYRARVSVVPDGLVLPRGGADERMRWARDVLESLIKMRRDRAAARELAGAHREDK
ncbi:MAG: transcription-repair coupling factor [Armatimonadetes bacterium]|nr:transcription-repair coupling factor [Armatimonadota bacterium]